MTTISSPASARSTSWERCVLEPVAPTGDRSALLDCMADEIEIGDDFDTLPDDVSSDPALAEYGVEVIW